LELDREGAIQKVSEKGLITANYGIHMGDYLYSRQTQFPEVAPNSLSSLVFSLSLLKAKLDG